MQFVELAGLALWCARGGAGGLRVRRLGAPLLSAPAHLKLQIEHNLGESHNVPDTTVQGTLATLQCALDPSQYRLVRGVLAHNLGECVDDLLPPAADAPAAPHCDQVGAALASAPSPSGPPSLKLCARQVWTTTSLKLDLHDVTVKLEPEHGVSSLACINFIKSRLLVETYSDLSQDIDLVSQVAASRLVIVGKSRRGGSFRLEWLKPPHIIVVEHLP